MNTQIKRQTIQRVCDTMNEYILNYRDHTPKEIFKRNHASDSTFYQSVKEGYFSRIAPGKYKPNIDKIEPFDARKILNSLYKEYNNKEGKNKQKANLNPPINHPNDGRLNLEMEDNGLKMYSITDLLSEIKRRGGTGNVTFDYKI